MSKVELFSLISLGFLVFSVVIIRVGFFLGIPILPYSLPFIFIVFIGILVCIFLVMKTNKKTKANAFLSLLLFIFLAVVMAGLSLFLSKTYDTSWDGQGYHQTAVIGYAQGWNPAYNASINLRQRLPSQIFAEAYPSALWELQASVYKLTGKINSAKVFNVYILIIAISVIYILLRKLKINRVVSLFASTFAAFQPVYILQATTFMQDGFGYELILIAAAALITLIISAKAYWSIPVFLMAELLLVTTKYSHLPIALILGLIFLMCVGNRILNHEYSLGGKVKLFIFGFAIVSMLFAYLPYIRNQLMHKALFYPTNVPQLMGSVKYNNTPLNIKEDNKLSLLFYGIFSKSQTGLSGDPRSNENIAQLKVPFTFSQGELEDAAGQFNNRVGAGGPLFSGIVLLVVIILVVISFFAKNKRQRYALYASYFGFGILLLLSLLTPTPNLLRYVNQLQLIPFAVMIPLYVGFRKGYVKVIVFLVLLLVAANSILYGAAVFNKNVSNTNAINSQFNIMRTSGKRYEVAAQHFYSSYIILAEQKVPFTIVDRISCRDIRQLLASSTTTQYCIR